MDRYEARTTLPFNDLERATSALRGELRLQAAYAEAGPQVPDWTTLVVTRLDDEIDHHGRTWWCWSGTVNPMPQPAATGSARTPEQPQQP